MMSIQRAREILATYRPPFTDKQFKEYQEALKVAANAPLVR